MGQYAHQTSQYTLEEQVKGLADEELLDFWEEAQYLEKFLQEEFQAGVGAHLEYERIIIKELQYRTCKKTALLS
ncbi:hypothetical protein [Desulfobaculum bizertense]|uniref:Uncharacterized protein n=1 Tax=Desulfobaculum bizertense DSM 18034 TaxID=1121442 RepID=A0A1T4W342_9BACT|nr:hypothetical protein [Desulfobaculum bizertense]UIJ38794.1 hypothetical protein LWC08_04270 [Desulfobaculum bizertense]SKA71680.1 hypothetical protein SAMN02745702_01534 [Desulfobaculum bizertense DSM 18034]